MEQRGWKLMNEKKYYTYILRCGDDTLYTGFTTDLEHRLQTHNAGKGAKYTKARLPVEMRNIQRRKKQCAEKQRLRN